MTRAELDLLVEAGKLGKVLVEAAALSKEVHTYSRTAKELEARLTQLRSECAQADADQKAMRAAIEQERLSAVAASDAREVTAKLALDAAVATARAECDHAKDELAMWHTKTELAKTDYGNQADRMNEEIKALQERIKVLRGMLKQIAERVAE